MTEDTEAAGDLTPISTSRRLLVLMPTWVGDCVMATPMLRALRELCGAAGGNTFIAGYMPPHVLPLFEAGGVFDRCIGGRPRGLLGPAGEAARLRALDCDTVLLLPNSFRAAWTAWLARIPRRIGYDRDGRGWLLTDRIPCPAPGGWHEPVPLVAYFLGLVAPIGVAPPGDASPRLMVADPERERTARLLDANGIDAARPIALLNPGATKPGKRWPPDRFAALASHLRASLGMQIIINGAPEERELTREIAARIDREATVLDLGREETTLATLAAICERAGLVVTNDTGTRHIAAAVGFERLRSGEPAPAIVTIFGTVPPEWSTLDYTRETQLYDRDSGRVDAITVEQVIGACRRSTGSIA